jgi:hypothetical protein
VVDPKTGQPNTAFPLVLAIAEQGGFKLPPEAIQNAMQIGAQIIQASGGLAPPPDSLAAQPMPGPGLDGAHPGGTTPVQPLNKHAADRDGMPEPSGAPPMDGAIM